jgi:hypothetical protein
MNVSFSPTTLVLALDFFLLRFLCRKHQNHRHPPDFVLGVAAFCAFVLLAMVWRFLRKIEDEMGFGKENLSVSRRGIAVRQETFFNNRNTSIQQTKIGHI